MKRTDLVISILSIFAPLLLHFVMITNLSHEDMKSISSTSVRTGLRSQRQVPIHKDKCRYNRLDHELKQLPPFLLMAMMTNNQLGNC